MLEIIEKLFKLIYVWSAAIMIIIALSCSAYVCMAAEKDIGSQQEEEAEHKADEAYDSLGRSASEGINNISKGVSNFSISSDFGFKAIRGILQMFYMIYQVIKSMAGILILISEVIGTMLYVFFKNNKKVKRIGLFGFCIIIPLIIIAIVYGIGILNGFFLNVKSPSELEYSQEYLAVMEYYGMTQSLGSSNLLVQALNTFYKMYEGMKCAAWILIVIFEAIGILKVVFNKYNKRKRRIGILGYCIAVPAALILLILGAEPINKVFMG